jgi:hypothetical protein
MAQLQARGNRRKRSTLPLPAYFPAAKATLPAIAAIVGCSFSKLASSAEAIPG